MFWEDEKSGGGSQNGSGSQARFEMVTAEFLCSTPSCKQPYLLKAANNKAGVGVD